LLGNGAGGFGAPISFAVGSNPLPGTVADLNLDGEPDIFVPNYFDSNVSVLLDDTVPSLQVKTLFDTTKAYKSGSTIPIKLQLVDCNGTNMSSPTRMLTALDLKHVGGTTSAPVVDSGNANPTITSATLEIQAAVMSSI